MKDTVEALVQVGPSLNFKTVSGMKYEYYSHFKIKKVKIQRGE